MNVLHRPWILILLIVALIGGVMWAFWPPAVPRPDEANRRAHPAGYSLIIPPGFDVSLDVRGNPVKIDGISASNNEHRSPRPFIFADRFRKPPDLTDLTDRQRFIPGQFMGRPAYIFAGPRGRPPATMWNHRVVFETGGDWFEIGVALPDYIDVPTHRWYDYLTSFRYEPTGVPTTTPTTSPAP